MKTHSNTVKTVFGYLFSLVERATGLNRCSGSLQSIYNLHEVKIDGDRLLTSGQPRPHEFQLIGQAGIKSVINLAPHDAENAVKDEALIVADLGMRYTHIPVDFKKPSASEFEQFCRAMSEHDLSSTWVHCAANMRVSAFVYRYRCDVLLHSSDVALKDLHAIWKPFGVWAKFVQSATNQRVAHIDKITNR